MYWCVRHVQGAYVCVRKFVKGCRSILVRRQQPARTIVCAPVHCSRDVCAQCVWCKTRAKATLGTPFKVGGREHQSRSFGRNIAGRRVCSILGLNQVFERGDRAKMLYIYAPWVEITSVVFSWNNGYMNPLNIQGKFRAWCWIHGNGKVWIAGKLVENEL